MNLVQTRRIFQGFFLLLFLWLSLVAWAAPRKGLETAGWPVALFLDADPLALVGSALATGRVHAAWTGVDTVGSVGVVAALAVLVSALFLGRVFCGWVCPLGTLQQGVAWLWGPRGRKELIAAHRYHPGQRLKYWLLAFFLAAALCGSLQIGWLDPLALLARSMALAVWPLLDRATRPVLELVGAGALHPGGSPAFEGGWLVGLVLLGVLGLAAWRPRFFCRWLCPLGALLGVLSRWTPFHIRRAENSCTGCGACAAGCQGAAEPGERVRLAECMACMNCTLDCPAGALSFGPSGGPVAAGPDAGRRGLVLGALAGLVAAPLARAAGSRGPAFGVGLIRPPGSVAEDEFLARCLKCGQCMRACPTGVLQPAWFAAGPEGVWTPVLDMHHGYCAQECVACGLVCPTGAIAKITPGQKAGLEEWKGARAPIAVGTAFVDTTRCLPWALDRPCLVCEEVCPVSPKAVRTKSRTVEGVELRLPWVDPERCTGCGLCQHHCPVVDLRAIRVSPVGERRSAGLGQGRERGLLLPGKDAPG